MGVVYHPQYMNWFEIGRTEWIRAHGFTYRELEKNGLYLPLVDATLQFNQPARYDDLVLIGTRVVSFDRLRLEFASEVRRLSGGEQRPGNWTIGAAEEGEKYFASGELIAKGSTRHVWLNADWKPVRLDRKHPELYNLLSNQKG